MVSAASGDKTRRTIYLFFVSPVATPPYHRAERAGAASRSALFLRLAATPGRGGGGRRDTAANGRHIRCKQLARQRSLRRARSTRHGVKAKTRRFAAAAAFVLAAETRQAHHLWLGCGLKTRTCGAATALKHVPAGTLYICHTTTRPPSFALPFCRCAHCSRRGASALNRGSRSRHSAV